MKKEAIMRIWMLVGLLVVGAAPAHAVSYDGDAFGDYLVIRSEMKAAELEAKREMAEAKARRKAAEERVLAERKAREAAGPKQLFCYPGYLSTKDPGILYPMYLAGPAPAGVTAGGGALALFTVDLDRLRYHNVAVTLQGKGGGAQPTVDILLSSWLQEDMLKFVEYRMGHLVKDAEKESVPSRVLRMSDRSVYAASQRMRIGAVKGLEFEPHLDSGNEGVEWFELECHFK